MTPLMFHGTNAHWCKEQENEVEPQKTKQITIILRDSAATRKLKKKEKNLPALPDSPLCLRKHDKRDQKTEYERTSAMNNPIIQESMLEEKTDAHVLLL
ncbi:hypothetical protein Y032_0248g103 [Ancylostoma ceylanicum]|nr:hypothetical protein Y032_0248g103 [Ancylostoma ceylanicum]